MSGGNIVTANRAHCRCPRRNREEPSALQRLKAAVGVELIMEAKAPLSSGTLWCGFESREPRRPKNRPLKNEGRGSGREKTRTDFERPLQTRTRSCFHSKCFRSRAWCFLICVSNSTKAFLAQERASGALALACS